MKRVVTVLLAAAVLFGVFAVTGSLTVNAESLYIRKIVSVVYDDSGSMEMEDKWAYANYAMQTFCGMLNSEDQLYITYMCPSESNPSYEPEEIDLSSSGIQKSVDKIRAHGDVGSTPYGAVDIAFDKLKNTQDSNANTQYWLVILTDGGFNQDSYIKNSFDPEELTDYFEDYVSQPMPNGTNPQITYFAIGNSAVRVPAEADKGIYTYSCSQASEIIRTMSEVADKVSGRTRLDKSEINLIDSKTVQISSAIPLLNIAVLTQETDAKIVNANYSNEVDIPVSRYAALDFREYNGNKHDELIGNACLLGDSKHIIGAGTYEIKFDKEISADDLVFLFEPALEMRVTVSVNGKKLDDNSELRNTSEGDKISISCGIYEMNTDNEISSDLLPQNTSYDIYVYEDGNIANHVSGKDMEMDGYELKNVETKLVASVKIEDFNPIEYSKKFTPKEQEKPPVYTIECAFDGGVKSIKFDSLPYNKDMKLRFTIKADGVEMTDSDEVKKLLPKIDVSPSGNSGDVKVENDGTVTYTPKKTDSSKSDADSVSVAVSCTISDGTSVSDSYTILMADYEVIGKNADKAVCKQEFYNNSTGVSFCIKKDGVQLDKTQVEKGVSVSINDEYKDLRLDITIDNDGTINCIPKSDEKREYNFLTWWSGWFYYFGLEGSDITLTLSHDYGMAQAGIEVVGADIWYILGWVVAPLATEIILIALIIAYIVRYVTKPRFASNAALYTGTIRFSDEGLGSHILSLRKYKLKPYNSFKNLWNPFKPLTVSVGGILISAENGGRIICREASPWFMTDELQSSQMDGEIEHPKDICDKLRQISDGYISVNEIEPSNIKGEGDKILRMNTRSYYCVRASVEYGEGSVAKEARRIYSAKIFCYANDR